MRDSPESEEEKIGQHLQMIQRPEGSYRPLLETIPLLVKDAESVSYGTDAKHYELAGVLNVGYAGALIVCRAKNVVTGQNVAVKRINLEHESADLTSIQREILATKQLSHPNLLPYYCTFIHNREVWAVMPDMQYGSAQDLIMQSFNQGMPELIAVFIIHDVLRALEYIHRRGLIHRSVKASHILISSRGRVCLSGLRYVCDMYQGGRFAKKMHHYAPDIHPNLNWLSPEILEQNLQGYNTKSDVYSVGITSCELANGVIPFAHMPPTQMLLEKVRGATPALLDSSTCSMPEEADQAGEMTEDDLPSYFRKKQFSYNFHQFVDLCLQKEPVLRPSVSQLLQHSLFKQCRRSASSLGELLCDLVQIDNTYLEIQDGQVGYTTDQMESLTVDEEWNF